MLPLLTISLYLIIVLLLVLLVYILRGIFKLARNKKQGPLPSRFNRAVKFLEKEGSVTCGEYGDFLGISSDASRDDLERLEAMGFVEQVGKENSYYRFIGQEGSKK